jgi:zinc transport system substrate-binding protein
MVRRRLVALFVFSCAAVIAGTRPADAQSRPTIKIGVTLHPYYSWTRNVVGDLPGYEVRPILPGEIDAGDYQPARTSRSWWISTRWSSTASATTTSSSR